MPADVPTGVGVLVRLAATHEAHTRLLAQAQAVATERNATLLDALEQHTHAEIADALGVSRGRVSQMVDAARRG